MLEIKRDVCVLRLQSLAECIGQYPLRLRMQKLSLTKVLLAIQSAEKLPTRYDLKFIVSNIGVLSLACKQFAIAKLVAELTDTTNWSFDEFSKLFEAAAAAAADDFVARLIYHSKNINLDIRDWTGETLLHEAVRQDLVKVCKELIARGVEANIKDKQGLMPLHKAAERGNMEIVRALLASGADMNVKDKDGRTPLHVAAKWDRTEMVRMLLASGSDVNVKDDR